MLENMEQFILSGEGNVCTSFDITFLPIRYAMITEESTNVRNYIFSKECNKAVQGKV